MAAPQYLIAVAVGLIIGVALGGVLRVVVRYRRWCRGGLLTGATLAARLRAYRSVRRIARTTRQIEKAVHADWVRHEMWRRN